MTLTTSRRGFLATAAAATGVLAIGISPRGALAKAGDGALNPFVTIAPDGTVTAIIKHFEKGQGTATGLSTLIAEELNMSLDAIKFEFAPSDPAVYNNSLFGPYQGTGGSTAMANSYLQYRTAGAAAREMLLTAAAQRWGVAKSALSLKDGTISGPDQSGDIGEFVADASLLDVPADPALKDPAQFRIIGNPDVHRNDQNSKIDGTAQYAMDLHLENQMVVVIKRSPRMGGSVASFDESGAQGIKGFIQALALPNGAGVAVYADKTWAALQAREAVRVTWDFTAAETRGSDEIRRELLASLDGDAEFDASSESDLSDTLAAIEGAAQVVEETFYFPLLAHAPMEPLTATIEPLADGAVVIHDGAQFPTSNHNVLSQILELPMEKVKVNTMIAGGSFGRRATPSADYQVEVALAFAMTDRTRPVKLVWSREDDITGGYYRPAFAHKVRVGLDDSGKIVGWDHRIAGQSIFKGTFFESVMVHGGIDHASVEGAADTPYDIPGMHFGLTDNKPATTLLWWRSVGHTHTAYVMESMMDIAAKAAGKDAVDFRLEYLSGGTPDQQRLAGVLELVAQKAGWGNVAKGRSQGVAVHKSFGSYVAQVAEISRDENGAVKIEKFTAAVDCGLPVNPNVIKAQIEGGIGYGIGAIMRNEITLTGGETDQFNFPDYEPLRMRDIGAIDTHIIASSEAPTGIGEPGTPPAGPALANAIAVDGPRITSLPMQNEGINFA
ncbi:Isoquinoline 1-oxidoreductase subunit beta [Roseobacter fucihabitans]|uniref:Isoquinoline 1-oxidoreductase subunit beta n=1 Tax=Roseobacter fucihabitans TaxID=1537242 RepID=A0ABZ2BTC9_9RHOB|nr:molybdopterin cofactor-binding domain-containing protein [Roseobacter litoralis]MBC6967480.1 Isoquinoline 1-oxidoreductase subunit beta [Roseobacter litoralis]